LGGCGVLGKDGAWIRHWVMIGRGRLVGRMKQDGVSRPVEWIE